MAVPYLLSGIFFRSLGSGDEKGIDFYQRGCLRLWCFQSSVLEVAKKYIIAGSSCLRRWRYGFFLRRSLIFSAEGKNRSIFSLSSRVDRRFQWQRETFFISFPSSKCVEVVHRCFWSNILNPPDDFSQLSYLKTLLSRTEAASRVLLLSWERPEDCYCDQILTIGVEKMLERRWRFSSSGWDVAAALLTF